jgi:hypothetical protein
MRSRNVGFAKLGKLMFSLAFIALAMSLAACQAQIKTGVAGAEGSSTVSGGVVPPPPVVAEGPAAPPQTSPPATGSTGLAITFAPVDGDPIVVGEESTYSLGFVIRTR